MNIEIKRNIYTIYTRTQENKATMNNKQDKKK